jgi:hypothetical protein
MWTVILVFPLIGVGVAWWWDPRHRARRLLARAEEKPLAAVVEGDHVRVRGAARRVRGSLDAPFSGRKCFAFRAVVEQRHENSWTEILRLERVVPFALVANGVEARVEGPVLLGLEIDHRIEDELSLQARLTLIEHDVDITDDCDRPLRLRCLEAALEEGDPIWVLGRARVAVDPRGQIESLRGSPVLRVFEGTKRRPIVLADEDSPGKLEWASR